MTLLEGCLEDRRRLAKVPLAQIEAADAEGGEDLTVGMPHLLGEPQPLLADGDAFGELANLRQRRHPDGARVDRRQQRHPQALAAEVTAEQAGVATGDLDRFAIVAERLVNLPQVRVGDAAKRRLLQGIRDREGPLTTLERPRDIADNLMVVREK